MMNNPDRSHWRWFIGAYRIDGIDEMLFADYLRLVRLPRDVLSVRQLSTLYMAWKNACEERSNLRQARAAGWRNVTGIDIVPEYLEIAQLRIAAYMKDPKQMTLGGD